MEEVIGGSRGVGVPGRRGNQGGGRLRVPTPPMPAAASRHHHF